MISPLLANLYLHWFDKVFHRASGPAHWAKAKLVRYADDFVVLAQQQTPRLVGWIETKLESWMGLEINREKTRVVKLRQQGASLDFLGFTFRYDRSRPAWGRHRYLNVVPSKKALARERAKLREHDQRATEWRPDPPVDRGVESTPERLGQLLPLRLSAARSSTRSTATCTGACGNICGAAASGPIGPQKG